jgi:arylformamidase
VTAVGALESAEFNRQNALIAQAWTPVFARDVPLPGCHHLAVCDELGQHGSALFSAAVDLVRGTRR